MGFLPLVQVEAARAAAWPYARYPQDSQGVQREAVVSQFECGSVALNSPFGRAIRLDTICWFLWDGRRNIVAVRFIQFTEFGTEAAVFLRAARVRAVRPDYNRPDLTDGLTTLELDGGHVLTVHGQAEAIVRLLEAADA
jgi:hypothetical protein